MGESGIERRKYSRIGTDQVISFAPVENRDLLGVSRNISSGGIRFEAVGCEINLGDTLRVTFNVGDHTVVAVGRVAWATDMDPITTDVGSWTFPATVSVLGLIASLGIYGLWTAMAGRSLFAEELAAEDLPRVR